MAENDNGGYIPLKDIADRQGISKKYLESIMTALSKNDLVAGAHGKGGGYRLTRKPEEYSLGEVLRLTEVSLAPVLCLENGAEPCERAGECRTLPVWSKLNSMINDYLDSVSVADLMRGQKNGASDV